MLVNQKVMLIIFKRISQYILFFSIFIFQAQALGNAIGGTAIIIAVAATTKAVT